MPHPPQRSTYLIPIPMLCIFVVLLLAIAASKIRIKKTDFAGSFVALVGLLEIVSWLIFALGVVNRMGLYSTETIALLTYWGLAVNLLSGIILFGIYCSYIKKDSGYQEWAHKHWRTKCAVFFGLFVTLLFTFKFFRIIYS